MAASMMYLLLTLILGGTGISNQCSTIYSEDINDQIVVKHQSVVHPTISIYGIS